MRFDDFDPEPEDFDEPPDFEPDADFLVEDPPERLVFDRLDPPFEAPPFVEDERELLLFEVVEPFDDELFEVEPEVFLPDDPEEALREAPDDLLLLPPLDDLPLDERDDPLFAEEERPFPPEPLRVDPVEDEDLPDAVPALRPPAAEPPCPLGTSAA